MPKSPNPKSEVTREQRLDSPQSADEFTCKESGSQPGQSLLAALDKFATELDREILRILRS